MCQKVTEMRSMIGHKKDNNLWVRGSERPTADTQQNLTKKPETPLPLSSRKWVQETRQRYNKRHRPPTSDQDGISPCNISTISGRRVMRIKSILKYYQLLQHQILKAIIIGIE